VQTIKALQHATIYSLLLHTAAYVRTNVYRRTLFLINLRLYSSPNVSRHSPNLVPYFFFHAIFIAQCLSQLFNIYILRFEEIYSLSCYGDFVLHSAQHT
jgi:hypothetical protein